MVLLVHKNHNKFFYVLILHLLWFSLLDTFLHLLTLLSSAISQLNCYAWHSLWTTPYHVTAGTREVVYESAVIEKAQWSCTLYMWTICRSRRWYVTTLLSRYATLSLMNDSPLHLWSMIFDYMLIAGLHHLRMKNLSKRRGDKTSVRFMTLCFCLPRVFCSRAFGRGKTSYRLRHFLVPQQYVISWCPCSLSTNPISVIDRLLWSPYFCVLQLLFLCSSGSEYEPFISYVMR